MKIIKKEKLPHKTLLIISNAYHSRRVKMTFSKVFKNSKIRIIPVMDIRKIGKDNWWKDKTKTRVVMGEIGKIAEYYLKGDLSLFT